MRTFRHHALLCALLLLAAGAAAWPVNLTVVHFNDWHNRVEANHGDWHQLCDLQAWPSNGGCCSGGYARMKRFVDEQRDRDPYMLLLNAGDDFIGTVWDTKFMTPGGYDGSQPAAFLNELRPDVMTVGNHEWDFGASALSRYLDRLNHPALGACNLQFNGHALASKIHKYVTLERQGVKVCIFGLTSTEVSSGKTSPVKVLDPFTSGKSCASEMKSQGCHVNILLSHMGYTADLYAAKIIPGLDLIVGGHSHSLLWNGEAPVYERSSSGKGAPQSLQDRVWGSYPTWVRSDEGRNVPVVQAGWGSRYMGVLTVSVDVEADRPVRSVSGYPQLLGCGGSDEPVDQDQGALQLIKKWRYW